jgi:GTPase SAR1 family protein
MNDFLNANIFDVNCDLLLIPISTTGTISNSFRSGLEKLNIATDLWENKDYELGDVKILPKKSKRKFIAFVCTVDGSNGAYYAIRLIGKRLAEKVTELKGIREIATPILGTGAGKLQPHLSLNIMRSAFYENKNVEYIRLTFCTPDEDILYSVKNHTLDIDTPSSQLVVEAEIPNIYINESVERIQYDKEFYYELAERKFNEFIEHELPKDFYHQLANQFKSSGITFKEFINSDLSKEQHEFTILCGELIAYIDFNAYRKNIWNRYPDKRVLAKSAVRQNDWFLNLAKFKSTNKLSSLSPSIKNAFAYLKSPSHNLTMLSENHRKKVLDNIFPDRISNDGFEEIVLSFFRRLGIRTQNPENFGVLCSRILYLPFVKPIWDESISKNHFLEDNLRYTDLSMASFLIEQCLKTNSKILDLGNCGLRDLEIIPELFECTHIEELILSNEWAEYKNGKWRKLTSKNKGNRNNIQSLPESMNKFSELKILVCGGDWNEYNNQNWNRWGITSLASISKLKKLEYLNLSNNELTNIIGLRRLTSLKTIHLNNNEISKVELLNELNNLKELYLSNNKIKTVHFISGLVNVQTVDLHNNIIRDLRPITKIIQNIGISNNKWELNTLNIAKNPLELPPMEIVTLGKEAVLGVFDDIEKRGRYVNKDIKVILVGNSEVGKSTLVKYLDKENGLEDEHLPTLWMEEKIINSKYSVNTIGEECLLHIFDFGGHDYYHDTHHLFYSSNTIYLLLWDKETNNLNSRRILQKSKENLEIEVETQDYPVRYWLDSVKFYTKDVEADNFESEIKRDITYDSPLLLIQNKVDNASKILFQDNKTLKKDYSFIYDIINISIKPKRNLDHFDSLFLEMLNKMNIIGAVLPKFYETIKNSISSYKGEPVLTFFEFVSYCNGIIKNPIDDAQAKRLVKYLEQVGLVLCTSKDTDEKIYIDKKWVIENMHKVLEKLVEKKGEFKRDYVVRILGSDDSKVDDLLVMMEEFKIIFKNPYSDIYIAPLYLPKIPDGKIKLFLNESQITYRRFEFKGFIQKNVILSIFQKFGTLFSSDKNKDLFYYWKDGLIIRNPNTDEIIMIRFHLGNEDGKACIDIYDLSQKEKPIFRDEVLKFIREVNQGYELEEMITLDGVDYISKRLLEENAKIGKHIFSEKKLSEPMKSKKQKIFKLKDFMKFIDNPVKKKKVVISYSKFDLDQVNLFVRHLQSLVDWDLIEEPWCCEHLMTGVEWDQEIQSRFDNADIIFFMVSTNLLSTKYVMDNEVKPAIERYDSDKSAIKVVPIILEYCDWARRNPINLQRFSAMPFKGKPISDFSDKSIVWFEITQAIRIMIENDISPEKSGKPNREIQDLYERQIKGKLDKNS